MKTRIARLPVVGPRAVQLSRTLRRLAYPGSAEFWDRHYARGGTSGTGSYGALARFKADVVNGFVEEHQVESAIEFGCGDGSQLSLATYASYIGLDVSRSAIERCKRRFAQDETKSFFLYDPHCFVDNHSLFSADLALSLDVIFHLTEDDVFEPYMTHLFGSARRFVVIYSSDVQSEPGDTVACVRHRQFSEWVTRRMPHWELMRQLQNEHRLEVDPEGSFADFFFYRRTEPEVVQPVAAPDA